MRQAVGHRIHSYLSRTKPAMIAYLKSLQHCAAKSSSVRNSDQQDVWRHPCVTSAAFQRIRRWACSGDCWLGQWKLQGEELLGSKNRLMVALVISVRITSPGIRLKIFGFQLWVRYFRKQHKMNEHLQIWYDKWLDEHNETDLIYAKSKDGPRLEQVHFIRDNISSLFWAGIQLSRQAKSSATTQRLSRRCDCY